MPTTDPDRLQAALLWPWLLPLFLTAWMKAGVEIGGGLFVDACGL